MILKATLVAVSILFTLQVKAQPTQECQDYWDGSYINKTVHFSLISRKNQTGHWITKFSLINAAQQLPKNWKADIHHSVTKDGGLEAFHIQGKLIVPPSVPVDYQLFPGVGYYKYHKNALDFDGAYRECAKEGGHLAIINSEAELQVIRSLVTVDSAYLGFHDRIKEGEFITIFGEPFPTTGFPGWAGNQPDNYQGLEDCGSYFANHGLNDVPCDRKYPFICEYDLTWAE